MPAPSVPEQRGRAWVTAAWLLTAGQTFWWHNDDPHRSLFSLIMTVAWAVVLTVVMTRPLQRAWQQAGLDQEER